MTDLAICAGSDGSKWSAIQPTASRGEAFIMTTMELFERVFVVESLVINQDRLPEAFL